MRIGVLTLPGLVFLGGLLLPPGSLQLHAQYEAPPPPAAWALQDVTVVHGDGRTQEGMTLVIRGGVIRTLEVGASVPDDARSIEWEGGVLHVYPGFVDGDGFAQVSPPSADRQGIHPWNPTREAQEFTPRRVAAEYLEANGDELAPYRRMGVVASVAFPGQGPAPGQASLILHRPEVRASRELVLSPSVGLVMSFQSARGVYPGTLFGVHALIRQGFLDAEHYAARAEAYGRAARGLEVDAWDEDLDVLNRVRNGGMRVFFRAHGAEDIRRVLALSDEIGFQPVIVGGHEAGKLAHELAAREVPVFLSLDFPRPDEWTPEEEAEEELTPAAFREKRRLEVVYGTAAALHEAGVPLAFTSGGSRNTDLLAGVRRTVEYGLPATAAVRALTRTPAGLLGVPGLGLLEEGRAANLVVTGGPIAEEGTRIFWTFVNGRAERGDSPGPEGDPSEADGPPADLSGTWDVELEVQGTRLPLTLVVEQDGASFTGTMESSQMGAAPIVGGRVVGSSFSFQVQAEGMEEPISVSGSVEGDRLRGTGSGPAMMGSFTFTGSRDPGGLLRGGVR